MYISPIRAFSPPQRPRFGVNDAWLPEDQRRLTSIKRYYAQIDTLDFEGLLRLFAQDAIYEREGWELLNGIEAITDFFRNKRKLQGRHHIMDCNIHSNYIPAVAGAHLKPPSVYVEGTFEGHIDDRHIKLTFKDLWIFRQQDNKVIFRKSWISTPGV